MPYKIKGKILQQILRDFAKAVAGPEKQYKRIDYNAWRTLANVSDNETITLNMENTSDNCILYHFKTSKATRSFKSDDKSFGQFFYNEFVMKYNYSISDGNLYIKQSDESMKSNWETVYLGKWDTPEVSANNYDEIKGYNVINVESIKASKEAESIVIGDDATIKFESVDGCIDIDYNKINAVNDRIVAMETTIEELKSTAGNGFKKKEKEDMNNKMFNFEFGPVKTDLIRMSMYGIAVNNAEGSYVAWDAVNGCLMNVDIINFDGSKFLYKMPVAVKDIAVGDIVYHMAKPMFVVKVQSKSLEVIDPVCGEKKEIMLARSPFGFDFATKLVSLLNFNGMASADADNPFGNIWMLMAMSDGKMEDMLLPMMMMNGGFGNMNPMMLYMMMSDSKTDKSILPLLMMANQVPGRNQVCNCNCICDDIAK